MAEHNEIGKRGENIAACHLAERFYTVLERNWRCGRLEVDIIACYGKQLIIVEVKTRSGKIMRPPDDAVNRKKQELLIRAANAYVANKNLDVDVRFDIITVIFENNSVAEVCHIENAFYPAVRN